MQLLFGLDALVAAVVLVLMGLRVREMWAQEWWHVRMWSLLLFALGLLLGLCVATLLVVEGWV